MFFYTFVVIVKYVSKCASIHVYLINVVLQTLLYFYNFLELQRASNTFLLMVRSLVAVSHQTNVVLPM